MGILPLVSPRTADGGIPGVDQGLGTRESHAPVLWMCL